MNSRTFILLFQCRDQRGIVAKISDFIFRHGGNIITADQHSTDPEGGYFFMRVEFFMVQESIPLRAQVKHFPIPLRKSPKVIAEGDFLVKESLPGLEKGLAPIAKEFHARYKIYDKDVRPRMGIMVSRVDHCLIDLLYLWRSGELRADIPFVISNCQRHRELVEQFNIPFHFIPADKKDRKEKCILAKVSLSSDFLVLARYMLVLSPSFLKKCGKDIINIHHGFLPSFKGPNPYRQALLKGVKVIGATAHFVNEKLDDGPIIAQEVEHVSHRDNLASLIRKGKNLEKRALSNAVLSYIDYRIIRYLKRTIVF